MTEDTITTPSTTERLNQVFNTRGKRVALSVARVLTILGGIGATAAGLLTGNPFLAGPATAFTIYAVTRRAPQLDLSKNLFPTAEPFKVDLLGAAPTSVLAALVASVALNVAKKDAAEEAERARIQAAERHDSSSVTIPAVTLTAREYFCPGGETGVVGKKLPSGGFRSYDCGAK